MNQIQKETSVLYRAAECCAALNLDNIPQEVVKKAEYLILDATVNFLEGNAVSEIAEPVARACALGQATLFGRAEKANAADAIFYNVVTGSITARNDHHPHGNVHPGSILVPAILAEAETAHLHGKQVLEAIIVGYEIMIRLGMILKSGSNYPPAKSLRTSMLPAPVGVAFAIAKLYGLDAETMANAAALACNHICGINQWRLEGTGEDVYQNAWDTINARHCVRLARSGVRGAFGNLEGTYGFLKIFGADEQAELILEGLGKEYKILETNCKVTGACARVLAPCQIAQELNDTPDFALEDLEELTVHINRKCTLMSWYTNKNIACQSEAINSVYYAVAATLLAGDIDRVSWFAPYDESIFALMEKIHLVYDDYSKEHLDPDGYRFEARMKSGQTFQKERQTYSPLSEESVGKRFLKTAAAYYSPQKAQNMVEHILHMETLGDLHTLTEEFSEPLK